MKLGSKVWNLFTEIVHLDMLSSMRLIFQGRGKDTTIPNLISDGLKSHGPRKWVAPVPPSEYNCATRYVLRRLNLLMPAGENLLKLRSDVDRYAGWSNVVPHSHTADGSMPFGSVLIHIRVYSRTADIYEIAIFVSTVVKTNETKN